MSHPPDVDLSREPFADGIDDRVLGRSLGRQFDRETGEVVARQPDQRQHGVGHDVSRTPWPPPSRGPLPPASSIPDDLNIFTAQDEIDAWAHEHDLATNYLAEIRRLLHGDDPEQEGVEEEYARKRAAFRRQARSNPTEKGRRTNDDITEETEEALIRDGVWRRRDRLRNAADEALGRLFRAKDNINRLDSYVRSLPRVDNRP